MGALLLALGFQPPYLDRGARRGADKPSWTRAAALTSMESHFGTPWLPCQAKAKVKEKGERP